MFASKLSIVALAATASSAAAQLAAVAQLSESCKAAFMGIVGDEKLNACLPLASVAPFINKETATDAGALNSVFKQMCSAKPCQQSFIDSYAANLTSSCAADLQPVAQQVNPAKTIATILKMYTPLQKAGCYVDEDKQFCLAKSILSLNIDVRGGDLRLDEVFNNAKNMDLCTKCNQHIVGTFADYIMKNPDTTFPITQEQTDKVMGVVSQKCGESFAQGVASATSAPYPNLQKQVAAQSSAGTTSFNAFVVFAMAGVALGARL